MPDPYHDNYCVIPHGKRPEILLVHEAIGWTLPRHNATLPIEINAAMQAQLGLTTTVLYCAYDRYRDYESPEQHRVYVLENHSPEVSLPVNGRWLARSELAHFPLAVPEHREILRAWFAEAEGSKIATRRLPWMHPGWFADATDWISEQLARLDYTWLASAQQITASAWSAMLRVPTTQGHLYFKASAPRFEPELTETLARLVPAHMPQVLAIDRRRHWMLMTDAGMTLRSGPSEPAHFAEALRLFAVIQRQLADQVETLKATGCPDRRLHILPALYQELLAATPFLLIDEAHGLPRGEYEQLLAFVPQLQEMCEELASYPIPESLEHDELHAGNILYNGQSYIFIDLAECCLAHPFCSLFIALRSAKYTLGYDDQALELLRDAYLAPWTDLASIEQLRRACALALRIDCLFRALLWYETVSRLEPEMRWLHADAVPYWLRVFLGTEE